ncbi:hypothetical protein [uncultured Aquimarina sp.]|uniref:hypothetical protein n=1 Tax=uncultured Aquimarina sp. TaxID=575652 RepID=UPI00260457FF|nr:hypothetical protein [uncultured Aquimarina sp.]
MEEFKKIVALSFIEAYKKYPFTKTKTALSKKISEEITEKEEGEADEKHYKSLVNYYDYFFNQGSNKQEPTETMVNKLLSFLNYDSREQFVKNQPIDDGYLDNVPFVKNVLVTEPEDSTGDDIKIDPPEDVEEDDSDSNSNWVRKIVVTISIAIPSMIVLYFVINWQQKECMVWKEDHYESASCNTKGISLNYNQDWVDNFKKAQNDTIETFFKQGDTLYWYFKRNNKVELFTKSGMHPVENVTLKPITETIVRNYILKE